MATPEPLSTAQKLITEMGEDIFVTSGLVDRIVDLGTGITTMAAPPMFEKDISVIRGPNADHLISGTIDDFESLFQDRYRKLSSLLKRRSELAGASPIASLKDSGPVAVIGMVTETITSRKGNRLARIEDETGEVMVLLTKVDFHAIEDEVIGVIGKLLPRQGSTGMIAADQVIRPQVERRRAKRSPESVEVVVISDLHFGSNNFLYDEWKAFVAFLNGEGPYSHASHNIKYILVAGDIVDGIGVYPGQIDDLEVRDIYEQYRMLASLMEGIPEDITVVLQVGNHDIVRTTEPQPDLPQDIKGMFPANVLFVPNPVWLDIHGVTFLTYHGRSIDDFVTSCPNVTYQKPLEAMRLMLDMRHLSPVYGGKTPIAPGPCDSMVIDPVPDVFVTGHVHSWGVENYRGTILINASTWQSQTDFQLLMNFDPMPARATVLNLQTMRPRLLNFMDVGA